ncbi:MAG: murein L,D-transpeptidase catalytic domain family protein [Pseudomonadota bacterium]
MARSVITLLAALVASLSLALDARSDAVPQIDGIASDLLTAALKSRTQFQQAVTDNRLMTIIDYRQPSGEPRFYLVDLQQETTEVLLVAHGRGSDPDHDGYADTFSNTPESKMSSLGAFVTGETYYGRHGLSLRLHGLEPQNDLAEARAIVIHGADYVSANRAILGRSWGCPALSQTQAKRIIPRIEGGTFVYVVGPEANGRPDDTRKG